MAYLCVLNDGETYSLLDGCCIVYVNDTKEITEEDIKLASMEQHIDLFTENDKVVAAIPVLCPFDPDSMRQRKVVLNYVGDQYPIKLC